MEHGYAYFAKWSASRDGGSLLEQALKNLTWRGFERNFGSNGCNILDRGRASA